MHHQQRSEAVNQFARLDVTSIALLLDVDGTLIDIGPTPQNVHVPDDLRRTLARLSDLTGGACALVSGRPIADLDSLFSPLVMTAVGGHGAERRIAGQKPVVQFPSLPLALRAKLTSFAGDGVIVEDKGYSVSLHYRNAPDRKDELRAAADNACARFADEPLAVLPGKAVFEIKRAAVNKGTGVIELMGLPPFSGRRPVFVGDDMTDTAVFSILSSLKGVGFSVGQRFAGASHMFETPGEVRSALEILSRGFG